MHHEKPIHKQTTYLGYPLSETHIQENFQNHTQLQLKKILILIACRTSRHKNLPGVTLFFGVSDKLDIQTWNPIIGQPWKKKVIRDRRKQSKTVISENLRISKDSFKRDIKFFLRVVLAWWGFRGRSSHKNHMVNFCILVDWQNLWNWSVGDPTLSSESKRCPELTPNSSENTYQETVWLTKPQTCKSIYLFIFAAVNQSQKDTQTTQRIASMIETLRNGFQTFPMETRGPRNTLLFSQH